jgi:hypothetical protein
VNRPNGISVEEWARYNERCAWQATLARAGLARHGSQHDADMDLAPYEVKIVEAPSAFVDLETAIHRAASELEEQGEKSNRIATQLLTALARFHAEIGL